MILLPIGHEEEGTRRLPWVTFGIMLLCGLAFLATGFGGTRTEFDAVDAYAILEDLLARIAVPSSRA